MPRETSGITAPWKGERPLLPGDFFAIRVPALPFATLLQWAEGIEAPRAGPELDAALERDRARLQERLRDLIERPAVRGAVFVASPDLDDALSGVPAPKAQAALVRYVSRMASRPTPFGLFAGCGIGRIGDQTRLDVPERGLWRRQTRLDADYLDALTRALAASAELRDLVTLRPNGSLHRQGERLRYVESLLDGRERSHHLVEVADSPHLERALAAAADGARTHEIAQAVAVDDDTAWGYVSELVEAQVLVPDLDVSITGAPPLETLLDDLAALDIEDGATTVLRRVREGLQSIDGEGFAASPDRHRRVAAQLEELPVPIDLSRLFQVDLTIPAPEARLASATAEQIAKGVKLLARLAPKEGDGELESFKEAFRARYEDREVPLLEALDEELGVGFGEGASQADPAPLLEGLSVGARTERQVTFGVRERHLLTLLQRAWTENANELALSASDIEALAADEPASLPDALGAVVVLAHTTGGPRILLEGADGPSGARLLGRFCHADAELHAAVSSHLRSEEALDPEAVFAEVVHLPSGRMANVLARPVLRDLEIEWLGRSGAPADRRLPASDLLVSVGDDRVVLRSRRLGRRVVPRLTSAHNWMRRSPGVYRFLCAVQADGHAQRLSWSWAPFDYAPCLPRVRCGQLVLARARWLLQTEELRALGADSWGATQALRARRGLPRWVVLAEFDNRLPIDLDNVFSVEAFARLVRSRDLAALEELFPAADELVAEGPDGHYAHEIVLPLVRAPGVAAPAAAAPDAAGIPAARRIFAPGSPWHYLKLYTGTATADRLLRDEIGALAGRLVEEGSAERWFFIRYADPGHHLRLRLRGDPAGLRPELEALAERALTMGLAHDAVFGTYSRELERYGGAHGIDPAERIFHADSDAVVELLRSFSSGADGYDERWRIGLLGAEMLMRDLGLDAGARRSQAVRMRDSLAREFRVESSARRALAKRFRAERAALDELLDLDRGAAHLLAPGLATLTRRSERIAPIVAELRALRAEGKLGLSLEELSTSYVHMWLNRLIRSGNRAHEYVIYDLLARLQEMRARGRR